MDFGYCSPKENWTKKLIFAKIGHAAGKVAFFIEKERKGSGKKRKADFCSWPQESGY